VGAGRAAWGRAKRRRSVMICSIRSSSFSTSWRSSRRESAGP
jgi:hypothetical protein